MIEGSKLYRRPMSIFWWTKRWSHIRFILRELTSLSVAFVTVEIMLLIKAFQTSPTAYQAFITSLSGPLMMFLNSVAILGLIFHSLTWFDLAPKAMVIKVGKQRLPGFIIAGSNYAGWVILSVLLFWILNGGL